MTADPDPAVRYPYKAWLPALLYWPYRGMRALTTSLCFAGFWSGAVLIGWLWFPILALWPGTRAEKTRRFHRTVRRGFRLFHATMHALRLYHRVSPVKSLRPGNSPVVLIANHPTLCDVTSIGSLFPDVVAVASPTYASNRMLARLVRMCGFVPLDRHVIRACEDRLRMGFDVLVFPEGTRSPADGDLHPFHRGAFEIAARAKVPMVLLKLTCVPRTLTKGLPVWKAADRMAVLTIEPFETIYPAASTDRADSRATSRAIEQRYRQVLGYDRAGANGADGAQAALGDLQ